MLRRLLFIRIAKGEPEQVAEVLSWGGDPNWVSTKGTPAIVRATRGYGVSAGVLEVLLKAGADPKARDAGGCTALDHARRRLAKYEGRPRKKPRRSPSLTAGGELRLRPEEWEFIDEMEAMHPGAGDEYLQERRRVAEKVWDPRAELERIVETLTARGVELG